MQTGRTTGRAHRKRHALQVGPMLDQRFEKSISLLLIKEPNLCKLLGDCKRGLVVGNFARQRLAESHLRHALEIVKKAIGGFVDVLRRLRQKVGKRCFGIDDNVESYWRQ